MKSTIDNLIKRTLMTPRSTPWGPLYSETGMIEIGMITTKNRINYMEKIEESPSSLLKLIKEDPDPKGWWKTNLTIREELLGPSPTPNNKKGNLKTQVKKKIINKLWQLIKEGENMTKTKFYLENKRNPQAGKRAAYMDKCNRMEASLIFRARCRMLNFKHNFRNMYQDTKCRVCGKEEETQEHALEKCKGTELSNIGKVTIRDIFEEDPKKLQTTALKIGRIMEKFQVRPPPRGGRPGGSGTAHELN